MFSQNRKLRTKGSFCRSVFISLTGTGLIVCGSLATYAQAPSPSPIPSPIRAAVSPPTPTPTPEQDVMLGDYKVTSTSEVGWRFSDVSGNQNQFQSNLNYRPGFRVFDTNLLLESESGKGKVFDSLLISTSGWGSDPSGFTRVNMEKIGWYKFDATVRRVAYFNNLSNHALGEHTQDWKTNLGDFDLTLFPQDDRLRISIGTSFSSNKGPGSYTVREYSDEFKVNTLTDTSSIDFRVGAEGKLLGFDWGVTEGFRQFNDNSSYNSLGPNPGNNTTNTAALATFSRTFPTTGHAYFTQAHLHRTFEKKLDFTARLIYSDTNSISSMTELITGKDNSNNTVVLDNFGVTGHASRPQTRVDLGVTYDFNDKFRISNTFTFDQFAVNGGDSLSESLARNNAAGNPLAITLTGTAGYRVNAYRRFENTVEGDYQINNLIGFHIGYRYTQRSVNVTGYDLTLFSPLSGTNPALINEGSTNHTSAIIGGLKIKPVKNWVIYGDFESGSADNVFTRLENYKYTNFRVRSRLTFNKFSLNVSGITKDNKNPSETLAIPPLPFGATIKTRFYSGSADWSPLSNYSFSAGYTYNFQTSDTAIIVPIASVLVQGDSQFYAREQYAFFDVSAKPLKRLSFYASYRIDLDKGQGARISTVLQNIITSYPMQSVTPEFRAVLRITRNIDWNVGYQYYNYHDTQTPSQNYKANLPYTSLRIYFGKQAADR